MTEETYNSWMERVLAGREGRPLEEGATVSLPSGTPFGAIEFVRLSRPHYTGEVGKKDGDYIYHFFSKQEPVDPVTGEQKCVGHFLPADFEEKMGDAFIQVFKLEDRLEAVYTEELDSWAVRARGFASNPMADELALKVFDVLDALLE